MKVSLYSFLSRRKGCLVDEFVVTVPGACVLQSGPGHAMSSTFFNDLHAFDFERKRWYRLGLRQKKRKAKLSSAERKEARKAGKPPSQATGDPNAGDEDSQSGEGESDENQSSDESDDDEDEDGGVNGSRRVPGAGPDHDHPSGGNNMFGYIDESGKVVYIDMNDMDDQDQDQDQGGATGEACDTKEGLRLPGAEAVMDHTQPLPVPPAASIDSCPRSAGDGAASASASSPAPPVPDAAAPIIDAFGGISVANNDKVAGENIECRQEGAISTEGPGAVKSECVHESVAMAEDGVQQGGREAESRAKDSLQQDQEQEQPQSAIAKYFGALEVPCPRINPYMFVR